MGIQYLIIFFSLWIGIAQAKNCKISFTDRPPAYISTVLNNTEESFLVGSRPSIIKASSNKVQGQSVLLTEKVYNKNFVDEGRVLKRGSLVTLVNDKLDLNKNVNPKKMVYIHVLSEKNSKINSILAKSKDDLLLEKGDKGYLFANSIIPLEDSQNIMILTKDTILKKFGGKKISLDVGTGIEPVSVSGAYKVNKCIHNGESKIFYLFRTIQDSNNIIELSSREISCQPIDTISRNSFGKINRFLNLMKTFYGEKFNPNSLEFNEWGLVNLPAITVDEHSTNIVSHGISLDYVHYKGSDPLYSDSWGDPDTVCEFIKVARDWKVYCMNDLGGNDKQCTIQVGDIGFITPGKMSNGKDPLYHRHHNSGTCIDIRPIRTDSKWEGTTINFDIAGHSTNLNSKFIDFVSKRGASPIYYNDNKIVKLNKSADRECDLENPENDLDKGVLSCPGHYNHIHFCLKPDRVKGCSL